MNSHKHRQSGGARLQEARCVSVTIKEECGEACEVV